MPEYIVWFKSPLWSSVEVEADNEEEAVDVAYDTFQFPTICGLCTGWGSSWDVSQDDWDYDSVEEIED